MRSRDRSGHAGVSLRHSAPGGCFMISKLANPGCDPAFIKLVRSRAGLVDLARLGHATALDLPGSQKG